MTDIKRMDAGEFQAIGFLQEANRLFFHPHGLALEITSVTDAEGPTAYTSLDLLDEETATLADLVAAERERRGDGENTSDLDTLSYRLEHAKRHVVGEKWVSGVWDYRDDPEGIVFGSGGYGDSAERAERVAAERAKHAETRRVLFGGTDIEPLDWVFPEASA